MTQSDGGAVVAEFDLLHSKQKVSIVSTHVSDITAAVNDLPRCRVRMTNGKDIYLAHRATEVAKILFPDPQ